MLTREEARKQPCRSHVESIEYDYHQNGDGVAHKIFRYHKCVANDCPRWVDIPPGEGPKCGMAPCPHEVPGDAECPIPSQSISCNDCPHRYGRCGG